VVLRSIVLSHGYAFAASSYSSNGWAVKEGLIQTHALRDVVDEHFGEPTRAYIAGSSMGGGITIGLVENFHSQYAGGLAMCGILAGADQTLDYVLGARAVFDYYYPGAIRGDTLDVPADLDPFGEVVPAVIGAVFADPAGAFELAAVDQLDIVAADFGELVNTLLVRLSTHALALPELLERTNGASPFDNTIVDYSGTSDDVGLNLGIGRFSSEPSGELYYQHYYEPDGRLQVPVIAMHTTRDPLVPAANLTAYETRVAEAGKSDWLVTQTVDRFGHCSFTDAELDTAFMELVAWVEDGTVPPSGDVTQP
jgi:dienelactone hydrolase